MRRVSTCVLTHAGRTEKMQSGQLPIDNLRKAVWRMLLQEHVERIQLGLVPGCVPRRPPTASLLGLPEMRVNPVDAPPDKSFYRRVEAAYKQWARAPLCSSARRRQAR